MLEAEGVDFLYSIVSLISKEISTGFHNATPDGKRFVTKYFPLS